MQFELSDEQNKIINGLIATGRFGTPEEVIERALTALNAQESEFQQAIADVEESLVDEKAGRVSPIQEAAERIRKQQGLNRVS